jgi:hypothetical protein
VTLRQFDLVFGNAPIADEYEFGRAWRAARKLVPAFTERYRAAVEYAPNEFATTVAILDRLAAEVLAGG